MATKDQQKSTNEVEKRDQEQRNARVGDHIVRELGHPSGLHRLQVRWLWSDHYRVNVLVGDDIVSAKVAHSYFVVADSEGNVLTSTPAITKEYAS